MWSRPDPGVRGTSRRCGERGRGRRRRAAACLALAGAIATPAHADGERGAAWVHRARQIEDLVVLRPLALVQTVASVGAFAVAYPIARLFSRDGDTVRENLLADPVERTFRRPLGDL